MQFQNYFLRAATNQDIDEVKFVVFTVLKEYRLQPDESEKDADLNDLEENYFKRNGYFSVVIDLAANKIIGTFGLYRISKSVCELRKMYLLKEARGKGLGKFILANAIEIAKALQYKQIVLETVSPLKEAITLYKKFGFKWIKPKNINPRVDQLLL